MKTLASSLARSRPTATRAGRPSGAQRTGFTLVELLVAITIIAILIALIVPAVGGATRRARVAQVRTEISSFDTAIADFKAKYGTEPPSSINLSENGNWDADARGKIRSIWSNFNFAQTYDFDGDSATTTASITLGGQQCLLFFLAGPLDATGAPQGFSKNPASPFSIGGGGERVGPFFEVDAGRVNASGAIGTYDAPNNYGSYVYIHNDDYTTGSAYLQTSTTFWKPKSYQIVCSGLDQNFGSVGSGTSIQYDPDDTDAVPEDDRDNITNFANATLAN